MSGEALVQRMAGGDGINVSKEGEISLGDDGVSNLASTSFDNIGTETVAELPVPEDTTLTVLVNLTARLLRAAAGAAAGSSASYTWVATVFRVDDGDPVLAAAADLIAESETASGTLPADWSAAIGVDTVDDSLTVDFSVANNSYAEGTTGNIQLSVTFTILGRVTEAAA